MGIYDNIVINERCGQVKLWDCDMKTYSEGDVVPQYGAYKSYSIAMRERGYVNINNCILESWTDDPTCKPIFDKYGAPFNKRFRGTFGEGYIK